MCVLKPAMLLGIVLQVGNVLFAVNHTITVSIEGINRDLRMEVGRGVQKMSLKNLNQKLQPPNPNPVPAKLTTVISQF